MSHFKKVISIKKVLKSLLGKTKAEKYLKGIEIIFSNSFTSNAMDIYQYALVQLTEGDTEKAINCIIFTLDVDREHKLTLHLCRTMLYGLTQFMSENNIDSFKQKNKNDIEGGINKLKKKYKELKKILDTNENDLETLEKSLRFNKSPLFVLFKKGKIKREIQELKNTLSTNNNEFEIVQNELNLVEEYLQKEEYMKVLGIVIEVCVFPSKFDPNLLNTNFG